MNNRISVLSILTLFCGCAPSFNLREPIYIVPKHNFYSECEKHSSKYLCLQTIVSGTKMWFAHLPPKKRPRIIIADQAPGKTANEPIFIYINAKLKKVAYFRIFPRPLAIIISTAAALDNTLYADSIIGHEFGHALLGIGHKPGRRLMNSGDEITFFPKAADLKDLHKKYPELN